MATDPEPALKRSTSIWTQDLRLIPKPLWGISLAGKLTATDWRRVKHAELKPACHACGERERLHLHERWRYDVYDTCGEAVLEALWTLCHACHDIMHPGRVLALQGDAALEKLMTQFAKKAGIHKSQARKRISNAFTTFDRNSDIKIWILDIALVAKYKPLRLKTKADEALFALDALR